MGQREVQRLAGGHAMQEMHRARELLLLVRRAPVQFPGHDVDDARERFGCALVVEEGQSDAPCDHVGRR